MLITCILVRTSASGYEANWAMLLEVMPAPKMAQGGGMPSYRSRRYSFSSSKVMMSTPAYGRIPICTQEQISLDTE